MILSNDNQYTGQKGNMLRLDEKTQVEEPFLSQLEGLGWNILHLDMHGQKPEDSYRTSFSEVVLIPELRKSLKKINTFLTEQQIDDVIRKITSFSKNSLIENNKQVLDYFLQDTTVARNEQTGEVSPTVRFIDFSELKNNSFLAISQFKINIPGTENHIVPDIVLFLNGLPIVVVECKSLKVKDAIAEAIEQLLRYSEQRGAIGEGNQSLFFYNQFLITTNRSDARFGTITTHIEKLFYRWSDPYPLTLNDLESKGTSPNDQQRIVAGMLSKNNLLDLIQTFTIFTVTDEGETIKVVARYQQYKAVKKTVKRLLEGKNRSDRSGIIWHTQGSGKSLTMMFMVREMRQKPSLMGWKIVFITDRTQLEKQLSDTSVGIGFTVKKADSIKKLKELLSNESPDLVMAMIHKFQERDLEEIFPVLNASDKILTMTDEAHRSQYSLLGANLDRAMPNATRIAYTGTPLDKTEKTYGDYIDKYTMRTSIDDGVTLEIVYEGRTHSSDIPDSEGMDKKFQDVFKAYNPLEKTEILAYGAKRAYMEATDTIKDKAADMIKHYLQFIFPNGFKAQVVACSREAAVRYKTYLDIAIKDQITELEKTNPFAVNLERLKKLETSVVISGTGNDAKDMKAFTDPTYHDKSIKRFKLPFNKEKDGLNGDVGIIVVNNMLLTGFDAPIEQVLYLDRVIVAHTLLQAIARVNRVSGESKDVGFVVDYVGVGDNLTKALKDYSDKEKTDITNSLKKNDDELKELIAALTEIWDLLKKYNCTDFSDPDAFFDLFYDEDIRFEYILAFKKLTTAFNNVLPQKEALDHFSDYKNFLELNVLAYQHFRDNRFSMKGIPAKLRAIADEFLKSKNIELKVKPISIIDDDFQTNITKRKRTKTKAAEVEHAIRHFVDINIDEDPELFASFSKALELILQEFKGNWEKILQELEKLREKVKKREQEETYGLHRKTQMPIFRIFKTEIFGDAKLSEDDISKNVSLTQNVYNLLELEISKVGFWDSIPAQEKLRAEIKKILLSDQFRHLPNVTEKRAEIITKVMEFARKNHTIIVQGL
jgi:type I restriction enzyme R subunit